MAKVKKVVLIFGDILLLYSGLALTLLVRYGAANFRESFNIHLKPFSLIFVIWILIFYLTDLYDLKKLKNVFDLLRAMGTAVAFDITISIVLFYLFTNFFELTPKTNLAIFSIIFGTLDFLLRIAVIKSSYAKTKLLLIGESPTIVQTASHLESNPQIGYELNFWLRGDLSNKNFMELRGLVVDKKIDIIVIPSHFIKEDLPIVKFIYQLLPQKIEVVNSADFFEMIFQKVPLEEIEEGWFIEKITTRRNIYDSIKRAADFIFGIFFGILFLPIALINAILIKLTSSGPMLYTQKRMGRNGKIFTLYKFRTMRTNQNGPLWTTDKDQRITPVGKILRRIHLDEISQLWNIIKGDISFIGPRAERLELAEYYSQLPYYEMRHIIKPGFTGWAQLNYRPSASLEEAFEKLKYDIFYIKNRSLFLDLIIIIRTIRLFFSNPD